MCISSPVGDRWPSPRGARRTAGLAREGVRALPGKASKVTETPPKTEKKLNKIKLGHDKKGAERCSHQFWAPSQLGRGQTTTDFRISEACRIFLFSGKGSAGPRVRPGCYVPSSATPAPSASLCVFDDAVTDFAPTIFVAFQMRVTFHFLQRQRSASFCFSIHFSLGHAVVQLPMHCYQSGFLILSH